MSTTTQGALLWEFGTAEKPSAWSVEELVWSPPQAGEVLVKLAAAGLCHSDYHYATGDSTVGTLPLLGGHEGAGVVVEVGAQVEGLSVGDHVVTTFMPACGKCNWCVIGRQNLCDRGAGLQHGSLLDGTYRVHTAGRPVGQMTYLGTFNPWLVCPVDSVVKIDPGVPLDLVAAVGCGVPTGWGSAVNAARVQIGDTVVVIGVGGVGMNAVQGASHAGAEHIVAVDPVAWKRQAAVDTFGATHQAESIEEAAGLVADLTRGVMAASAMMHLGISDGSQVDAALGLVSKGGALVISNMSSIDQTDVRLSLRGLALMEKEVRGAIYGRCNPRVDIPRLVRLYQDGRLKLEELVTRRYRLSEINEAYSDMIAGKNIRGIITYDD